MADHRISPLHKFQSVLLKMGPYVEGQLQLDTVPSKGLTLNRSLAEEGELINN